jgi:transcriptional regulator with XRE-family HTH domain
MSGMNAASDTAQPAHGATQESSPAQAEPPARALPLVDFSQRLTRLVEETRRPDGQRWTLSYVADECGARGVPASRQYLAQLVNGQRDEPRLSLVEALADVFAVPAGYFAGDHLGRLLNDLLPLLAAQRQAATVALLQRPDLAEAAAALADPAVADFLATHHLPEVIAALAAPAVQAAVAAAMSDSR